MGNYGSTGAQQHCNVNNYVYSDDPKSIWRTVYEPCRNDYDSGNYALRKGLESQVENLKAQVANINAASGISANYLDTCNTKLDTCNTDKLSAQSAVAAAKIAATSAQTICDTDKQRLTEDKQRLADNVTTASAAAAAALARSQSDASTAQDTFNKSLVSARLDATINEAAKQSVLCSAKLASAAAEQSAACMASQVNPIQYFQPTTTEYNTQYNTPYTTQYDSPYTTQYDSPASTQPVLNINKANIEAQKPAIAQLNAMVNSPGTYPVPSGTSKSSFYDVSASLPDLKTYQDIYTKSVALTDDPNNYNQVAFDTYMYLQNKKINGLQSSINSLKSQIGTSKQPPIKAFRNMENSHILNLEEYPNPSTPNNGQPSTYKGNGSTQYPNYLIYGNNGCLQYNPASSSPNQNPLKSAPANWSFTSCNASKPNQQFYAKQITSKTEYNNPIKDPKNASYKISDPSSTNMGFYVVNPRGMSDQCLQLNSDGLSVMPCNMDSSQRFKPMYRNALP
jgi:hypothetical protein